MLVLDQITFGTVGGGQLEYLAIDHARQMLRQGIAEDRVHIALGPEIGQCCGGRIDLKFQQVTQQISQELLRLENIELRARPSVYVFGAGHVGNAVVRALALLPLRTTLIDSRQEELVGVPRGTKEVLAAMPEKVVREAFPGSAFLILTHDHALDFLIAGEALTRNDAAYVGMIGSKSKRSTFEHWFVRQGGDDVLISRLVCPMGGNAVKDKRPEVIASLVAAELVRTFFGAKQSIAARGVLV